MPTRNAGKESVGVGSAVSGAGRGDTPSASSIPIVSKDLRKHLRFKIEEAGEGLQIRGHLTVLGMGHANIARATLNLSEGGALILATESLAVGTKVHLKIEAERYNGVIESEGEVRWCFESALDPGRYYVGVAFTRMDPVQENRVRQMREWFSAPDFKAKMAAQKHGSSPDIDLVS